MTRPILRVDTHTLPDDEFAAVEQLLDALGVQGEELQPHLGIPEALDALLVLSTDSLQIAFEAMLAAAGGAAGAKLGDLLGRLPRRRNGEAQVIAGGTPGGEDAVFLVTKEAAGDADAMNAMLHFDIGLLSPGDVIVWDPQTRKWRRQS